MQVRAQRVFVSDWVFYNRLGHCVCRHKYSAKSLNDSSVRDHKMTGHFTPHLPTVGKAVGCLWLAGCNNLARRVMHQPAARAEPVQQTWPASASPREPPRRVGRWLKSLMFRMYCVSFSLSSFVSVISLRMRRSHVPLLQIYLGPR